MVLLTVHKVQIAGITNTDDEFLKKHIFRNKIFESNSLEELNESIKKIGNYLKTLDVYQRDCKVTIGKHDADNNDPFKANVYVRFDVEEKPQHQCKLTALCKSDNGIGMHLNIARNNNRGRGENFHIEAHHDIDHFGGSTITYQKPLENYPYVKWNIGTWYNKKHFWWSDFYNCSSGVFGGNAWKDRLGVHDIRMEIGKHKMSNDKNTSIELNDDTKVSIKYTLTKDQRIGGIFPTAGYFYKLSKEAFKSKVQDPNDLHMKLFGEIHEFVSLGQSIVLESSFSFGSVKNLLSNTEVINSEKFVLGGPLNIRGFNYGGIGPSQGSVHHGVDNFWLKGIHAYIPLPLKHNIFKEHFRIHGFWNVGSHFDIESINTSSLYDSIIKSYDNIRASVGCGLVLKILNGIRIELNYCIPIFNTQSDKLSRYNRFQIGIGVEYL